MLVLLLGLVLQELDPLPVALRELSVLVVQFASIGEIVNPLILGGSIALPDPVIDIVLQKLILLMNLLDVKLDDVNA